MYNDIKLYIHLHLYTYYLIFIHLYKYTEYYKWFYTHVYIPVCISDGINGIIIRFWHIDSMIYSRSTIRLNKVLWPMPHKLSQRNDSEITILLNIWTCTNMHYVAITLICYNPACIFLISLSLAWTGRKRKRMNSFWGHYLNISPWNRSYYVTW